MDWNAQKSDRVGVPNRLACQKFGKPEPSRTREHQFKEIKGAKEVASILGASSRNEGRTPADREAFDLNRIVVSTCVTDSSDSQERSSKGAVIECPTRDHKAAESNF